MVSVVLAVYNGKLHLAESVESILKQESCNLELILVNDGSTDNSGEIAIDLAREDQRIRVFHQGNQGLTRALIRGCAEAKGLYLARHDVGDVSLPMRLAEQARALDMHANWSFVSCQWELQGPTGERLAGPCPPDNGRKIVAGLRSGLFSKLACPHHGAVMMRRSAYEAAGGYRSEFYFAQDLDLWTRLVELGELGFVDNVSYLARFTEDCISARHRDSQEELKALIAKATRLRRAGQSEAEILQRASAVRPSSRENPGAAEYFIASCLFQEGDSRAAGYFKKAISAQPGNLKAWAKLAACYLRGQVHP